MISRGNYSYNLSRYIATRYNYLFKRDPFYLVRITGRS